MSIWHSQWKRTETSGGVVALEVSFTIADLEIIPVLEPKEYGIGREALFKRAKLLGALTEEKEFAAFSNLQEEFPADWNKATIVFPGTIWKDNKGNEAIAALWRTPDAAASKQRKDATAISIDRWHRHLFCLKDLRGMSAELYRSMHFARLQ